MRSVLNQLIQPSVASSTSSMTRCQRLWPGNGPGTPSRLAGWAVIKPARHCDLSTNPDVFGVGVPPTRS